MRSVQRDGLAGIGLHVRVLSLDIVLADILVEVVPERLDAKRRLEIATANQEGDHFTVDPLRAARFDEATERGSKSLDARHPVYRDSGEDVVCVQQQETAFVHGPMKGDTALVQPRRNRVEAGWYG